MQMVDTDDLDAMEKDLHEDLHTKMEDVKKAAKAIQNDSDDDNDDDDDNDKADLLTAITG